MNIQTADALLLDDEGIRIWPYVDTAGHRTWGIGHNLDASPPCTVAQALLQQAVQTQFGVDLNEVKSELDGYPWMADLDVVRQAVVIDMAFNLGLQGLATFTTFLSFMAQDRFKDAAADLRTTRVYRELPRRYERLAVMLETGQWPN